MALDFPDTPTNGATYTAGGISWTWDGTKWAATGAGTPGLYLPLTGGTVSGALTVNGATTLKSGNIDNTIIGATTPAAASVTSQNGGQLAGMRNLIINGDFRVNQRYGTAGVATPGGAFYGIDRWLISTTIAYNIASGIATSSIQGAGPYAAAMWSTASHSIVAADAFLFQQAIEAQNMAHLQWGTPRAQPITISAIIWSDAGLSGNISLALRNGAANRSYVTLLPVSNSEAKVSVTIPGDTAGTWANDNTAGIMLSFDLGSGSNYTAAAANAWSAGNFVRAPGQTYNNCTAVNVTFHIRDVQIELGTVATPFERRPIATELTLCQRYYQRYVGAAYSIQLGGYNATGSNFLITMLIPPMRVSPTTTIIGTWSLTNCSNPGISAQPGNCMSLVFYTTITTTGSFLLLNNASSGFDLSAEL
jgi:hypothetical protein